MLVVPRVRTLLPYHLYQLMRLINMRKRFERRSRKECIFWTVIHHKNCSLRQSVRQAEIRGLNHWFKRLQDIYSIRNRYAFLPTITYQDELNSLTRINTTLDPLLLPESRRLANEGG